MAKSRLLKEKYITFNDLSAAAKTMTPAEFAVLEAKYWAQSGINPETDLHTPEMTAKRFDAMLDCMLNGTPLPEELGPWK